MYIKVISIAFVSIFLWCGMSIAADIRAAENIDWEVVSGGAGVSSCPNYFLIGTIGQTAAGPVTSGDYGTNQGYVQDFGQFFVCDCIPGNFNEDGYINVVDIIDLIDYKFREGPPPHPYAVCNGDADCNCIVNVIDIMLLINYKFREGDPPCGCSDWVSACGVPVVK